jgi:hypothetical protein
MRIVTAALVAACWPFAVNAQGPTVESQTSEARQAQPSERRVVDVVAFLAGGALGLGMHESGHLLFDAVFDANPRLTGVHFGPFPFFALTHRGDLSPRREFTVSSAGFWVQEASNEWLLSRPRPLKDRHAPLAKGVLTFNVLNSVGYAVVAFAKAGPFERDTRGMAASVGVDERTIGFVILTPAVLDGWRFLHPDARWAVWASRAAKIGSVVLVAKRR